MRAKWKILLFLIAGLMTGGIRAQAGHDTSLAGLVNLTNYQAALLVITDSPPEAMFPTSTHKWVTEGQSYDDLNVSSKRLHVEISQIDFTNGVVRVKENGVSMLYVPRVINSTWTSPGKKFHLDNVSLNDALDFYADATGRTMLVYPDVELVRLNIAVDAQNKIEAAGSIEKYLQQKGIVMLPDGDKFEWVVPASLVATLSPAPAGPSAQAGSSTNTADGLPAGSINFINVPLPQALDVYQALTSLKWVQDKPLKPAFPLTFHNQTPLNKNDILHVFTILLGWHGLEIVSVDDKSFKLVPLAAASPPASHDAIP